MFQMSLVSEKQSIFVDTTMKKTSLDVRKVDSQLVNIWRFTTAAKSASYSQIAPLSCNWKLQVSLWPNYFQSYLWTMISFFSTFPGVILKQVVHQLTRKGRAYT